MRKYGSAIVAAVALIASAAAVFMNLQLKSKIDLELQNFSSLADQMEARFASSLAGLDAAREEQERLIYDPMYTYGKIDFEKKTAEVKYAVTPKQYNPKTTKAAVVIGGKEYPMELDGAKFEAEFELPLFEESAVEAVRFTDGDTVRQQSMNYGIHPRNEVLPSVTATFSGSYTGPLSGQGYVKINGKIDTSVFYEDMLKLGVESEPVKDVYFVEYINGEQISKTAFKKVEDNSGNDSAAEPETDAAPVTDENGETKAAVIDVDTENKTTEPTKEVVVGIDGITDNYTFDVNKRQALSKDDVYEAYAEVVFENGVMYRAYLGEPFNFGTPKLQAGFFGKTGKLIHEEKAF